MVEYDSTEFRYGAMLAAMLIAVNALAGIYLAVLAPPAGTFFRTLVTYIAYGDVFSIVLAAVLGWPMHRYLARFELPLLVRAAGFALAGCLVGIPFAIVGAIVDGSAAVGIFGVVLGAWAGGVGRLLYALVSRSTAAPIIINVILLTVGAIGVPIALGSLFG